MLLAPGHKSGALSGHKAFALATVAGTVAVVALVLLSIAYGSTLIPLTDVIASLGHAVGLNEHQVSGPVGKIVVDLRLPRTILAVCVGGGLGITGALLQTVTRNDLADPFLFGLSSGAAAGAVSVITVFGDSFGIWTLPVAAFTGGILAACIVLLLVARVRGQGPERLILAGLAVSFLFTALTNSGFCRRPARRPFGAVLDDGWARAGALGQCLAGRIGRRHDCCLWAVEPPQAGRLPGG
jgi:iron complex transport system permease protein